VSARDEILAGVRRALNVTGAEAPRRMAVAERLAQAPGGIVPMRGQGDATARAATFKAEAERAQPMQSISKTSVRMLALA
jgi:L-lactate dehydrogenase complex protein LldG